MQNVGTAPNGANQVTCRGLAGFGPGAAFDEPWDDFFE
jgi:hypothetical protein